MLLIFFFPFSTFYGKFYQGLLVRSRKLPASSVAKGCRHESLKRVWELGKCHTDTHMQPHTLTVELMEFAFWQLSSWGTATTKITFHLVVLFLSNYASGEKQLAETECSLAERGEFKGTGKFICYTNVVFVRRLWPWTGGLVGARRKLWQIWSQQSVFTVFLHLIPSSCCHK